MVESRYEQTDNERRSIHQNLDSERVCAAVQLLLGIPSPTLECGLVQHCNPSSDVTAAPEGWESWR